MWLDKAHASGRLFDLDRVVASQLHCPNTAWSACMLACAVADSAQPTRPKFAGPTRHDAVRDPVRDPGLLSFPDHCKPRRRQGRTVSSILLLSHPPTFPGCLPRIGDRSLRLRCVRILVNLVRGHRGTVLRYRRWLVCAGHLPRLHYDYGREYVLTLPVPRGPAWWWLADAVGASLRSSPNPKISFPLFFSLLVTRPLGLAFSHNRVIFPLASS
jgi:hypothetical protein